MNFRILIVHIKKKKGAIVDQIIIIIIIIIIIRAALFMGFGLIPMPLIFEIEGRISQGKMIS